MLSRWWLKGKVRCIRRALQADHLLWHCYLDKKGVLWVPELSGEGSRSHGRLVGLGPGTAKEVADAFLAYCTSNQYNEFRRNGDALRRCRDERTALQELDRDDGGGETSQNRNDSSGVDAGPVTGAEAGPVSDEEDPAEG